MYVLEKKHMPDTSVSNNTCRYLLTVSGHVDAEKFESAINDNHDITWLASLTPVKPHALAIPRWQPSAHLARIPVQVHHNDEAIPSGILARKINIEQPPALTFDLVYRPTGETTIILSWNHLLMDGYGAILLLTQIAVDLRSSSTHITDTGKPLLLSPSSFWQATRAKFFVDRVSRKPLSGIMDLKRQPSSIQKIRTLQFTVEETATMDKVASSLGAQFGRSPLYLACAARSVYALLEKEGKTIDDFWIPVPRNQRKKGAKGPILGNHIAFLFYRIKVVALKSFAACVQSINQQTIEQIRTGMANAYDILIRYLRRTPHPLYYFWIKGPKGGALSSFLFTVAIDHPDEIDHFAGHRVVDGFSIPSNIYPPGLTFAFIHFQGALKLMILYFDGLLSAEELNWLEAKLRFELTTGKSFQP
jgi:hypothetical protein